MAKIEVTGQTALLQRLRRVRAGIPPIVGDVGADKLLLKRVLDRFDKEVGPDGVKWRALAPSTLKRRREKGISGTKILYESGTLKKSIAVIRGRSDGQFAINTGLGFRIGVTGDEANQYARIHQRGGVSGKPPHTIPKRTFLGLNELDVKAMRNLVYRRMAALLKG